MGVTMPARSGGMVKRTRQTGTVVASVFALALFGAGCQAAAPKPQASAPPSATENQMNPQPREKLQDGGQLVWPIDSAPANFNYNELDGPELNNFWIVAALLPGPFHFDAGA